VALDGIPKFSTSRCGVAFCAQFLKHSFSSKVVNERPLFGADVTPNYCEILPHRSMVEKLSNECVPIRLGFCKEKDPGCKTIDAMHDECSLPFRFQFCGKKRQGGRSIGALHRHRRESSRFVDSHDGIVFVKYNKPA
jgi:hypothetical protein